MGFTRDEYNTVQEMIKRIRKLERELEDANNQIDAMQESLDRIESSTDMADWTDEQWRNFLRPLITAENSSGSGGVPKHTHENDQQGGPCFAEKGARLLD